MLQLLPTREQKVSLMNHLGRLPFYPRHVNALFIHSKIRVSNFLDATRDTSPEDQISRLLARSSRHMSHLISTTSDMNERQKKNCMPMIWYQLLWSLLQFYLLLQGMDSRVTDPFPGMTVADLLLQGWRTPCYHEGRVHLIAVPARFACALPICCCGSSGLDVHMSPFAANWLNLPFSLWSLLHNWWMNVK